MFELENVELKFTNNALKALASRAIKLETGARGLRSVMESIMLDIMYTLPSTKDVAECVINKAVVEEGKEPLLLFKPEAKSA
jgi:ATP-dependent Clp protease ATP-binding subunit ClpX